MSVAFESERASITPSHVVSCPRCLVIFLLFVLSSLLAVSIADHISWSRVGYESTAYNGSTLRSLRELARPAVPRDDSWKPILEALDFLRSPDGDRLYEKIFFEQKRKFQYPPTSLVYLAGLEKLGWASVDALNTLNAAIFAASCAGFAYLIILLMPPGTYRNSGAWHWALLPLLLAVSFFHYPLLRALELGQIQVWINALFLAACIVWLLGSKALSGVMIAIAATIKPQFGVFLIWAILWREWSFLRGFLAVGLPIGLLSIYLFGLHNHLAYLEVLSFISKHGEAFFANHSVNGIAHRAIGNGDALQFHALSFPPSHPVVGAATFISTLAILLIVLAPALRAPVGSPDISDFAIGALGATLASPIAWEHHYGILLPMLGIVLVRLCSTAGSNFAFVALAFSWMLSTNYMPATNHLIGTSLSFAQAYLFISALVLLGLLFYVRSRNGIPPSQ